MAHARLRQALTPAEYLAGEAVAGYRHEHVAGRVFAMAGGNEAHDTIALNMASRLNDHVAAPCHVFMADMKLRTGHSVDERYYYPDVLVSCSESTGERTVCTDACLVIEVISPSTERTDRHEKFLAYATLPSLQENVLVEQATPSIEVRRRTGSWAIESFGLDDVITLASVDFTLPARDIFRRIFQ